MKKLWLVVALVAWGVVAVSTFADVQNIRLSGDIRIRGYYLANAGGDSSEDQVKTGASFISQRTRVSVEADLEDHVLVVVTLKAESLWGSSDEAVHNESGAGHSGFDGNINRRWDLGVTESYVQFNELFYTSATLKLGRQYLHYGRGLIISSTEQEYNYDAARLVLDYYPLTIDLVGAELVNNQVFGSTATHAGSVDLLFVNARYELSDSAIKDVEAYFGWVAQGASGPISVSRVPPTSVGAASPWIIGLRSDMNLTEGLQTWVEGVYEGGSDGTVGSKGIQAILANVGGRYTLKNTQWSPVINANFTYASGGGEGQDFATGNPGRGAFRPWFDYVDGYNGYLLAPTLSNIMIFNLGASVKPYENTTLALQGYYYYMVNTQSGLPGSGLVSNGNVDFGGLGFSPSGSSHDLGWEFDSILGYDYSKDTRFQLVYAMFIPGNGFTVFPSDSVAHEVRAEVNVKF